MGLFSKIFGDDRTQSPEMSYSHSTSKASIAKDLVCGMDVDVNKAAAKSEYQGQTYYFCASSCKQDFDKNPARYISGKVSSDHSHGCGCCC